MTEIGNVMVRVDAVITDKQYHEAMSAVSAANKRMAELQAENAELRELSSIMLKCIMANERKALICWECPAHKQFDELRWFCCIKHDAAELGIEVDEC